MAVIEVSDMTKEFQLGQFHTLKTGVQNLMRRVSGRAVEGPRLFQALRDIGFSVEAGEVVGVIGSNGAGKSTLLKILSGITTPTRGTARVNGRVAPLIEVGAGLHHELTGRENIFLNASILGVSHRRIEKLVDPILEFAEIKPFADTPVKKYSSGMKVRLGFAIATNIEADILIVDEVLAVGDIAFQRKCFDKMEDLILKQKKTVLLVSHNIRQVQRICTRVLLFEDGRLLADGPTQEVCQTFFEKSDQEIYDREAAHGGGFQIVNGFELLSLSMHSPDGRRLTRVRVNEPVNIRIHYRNTDALDQPKFGIGVHTSDFLYLTTYDSRHEIQMETVEPGEHEAVCHITRLPFTPGVYSLRLGVSSGGVEKTIFYGENLLNFQVVGEERFRNVAGSEGLILLDAKWQQLA
ncbi:Teichoic-acid-transporting ATPase [Solidesulfovibrio carbinoliphilus subsp. oakridgensis]|uniref:Teichoic-acid-transporting ATPase n=2 Tax=Solidesulfovibrio carbinoliphilus TaxID=345370 RepID=G7QCH4_9BACT|nr:ABC transporter ATP-binding protein [Solidesulfovibrio carbinoliphilus]EHJ46130.1 Teichoic-acid-transporting ATPase [Solidesulfovibrio carbinoliphilus subsp. oakridgensis]